jgi:F-box/leucine-rich repeat protein 4
MNDLFPDHVNTAVSAFHSLHLNTDHKQISKIYTHHTYPPAARFSRILKIPLENKVSFPTRHIRLEFDHCTANYYIEIDTITLCGQILKPNIPLPIVDKAKQMTAQHEKVDIDLQTNLLKLPFDLLFIICSHLDLRSLIQLSSTCRCLRELCLHPLQFQSLNLQPYWNGLTNDSIENFFVNYCIQTRYLSLAWTKSIQYSSFKQLLNRCSISLLQLNLACCQYLTGEYIEAIANFCPHVEILNFENCLDLSNLDFVPLKNLHHIRSLNVYRTNIDYRTLLPLIDNNKEHLKNINLGKIRSFLIGKK